MVRKKPAEIDPDETVTYDARPVVRGARVLCFTAGLALVAHHLLLAVALTPFLGAEAFVWGNVLGSLIVSLGGGMFLGEVLARLFGGAPRATYRILAVAGVLIVVGSWGSPHVARAVLDRDPDSPWAPVLVFGALTVIPGFLLASIVPAMIEASVNAEAGAAPTVSRRASRRFALAMLGGVAGLAVSSFAMRHADEAKVWAQLYGLGGLLLVLSLAGLGGPGRGLVVTLVAALAGVVLGAKSEIQSPEYEAALTEAFVLRGAGRYYAENCPEHILKDTQLKRHLDQARKRLQGGDKDIAVLLVVETLKTLGPLNLSGSGLRGLLDIYLPPESKPLVLPFIDQIASVQSDGKRVHIRIARSTVDGHAHFSIPAKNGETQEFEILDDFDLTVLSPNGSTTKLEIGPQTVDKAGVFEFNDTIRTPFKCKNVFAWVDASLLSLTVENGPQQVVVSARAQASISDVKTRVLQVIEKKAR